MGLITGLLTLPLAPVRGVGWVAEKVAEEAERELYDEDRIMQDLAHLEAAGARGEISDAELDEQVELVLERLERAHELRLARESGDGW